MTAEDHICGRVLVLLPMKRISSLILLLVRLVSSRYEFLDRCRFGTEKVQGVRRLGWCAWQVRVRSVQVWGGSR